MDFTEELRRAKPNITATSLKTYNSILRTLYKRVFENTDKPDIEKFKEVSKIMEAVKDDSLQTRKTKLSAVMAVAPMEEYRKQIYADQRANNALTERSEMTDKLKQSEITTTEINDVVSRLKKNADAIYKKPTMTMKDLAEIQNYIIISLYHGHIAPRRATDFCEMLLKPMNKETQNYIDLRKSKFVFNIYKTAKTYGKQEIAIPPALKKILKKWIDIIPEGINHLLFNTQREPLTNVSLNQRLNDIFGGHKSVNSLRHYYLTEHHSETVRIGDKLAEDMRAMGSDPRQVKTYVKIN